MEQQTNIEEKLRKLQNCAYIIIILLVVNTIALFISLGDPKPNTNTSGSESEESYEYDVSMFKEVDKDGYMDAFNKDEINVVYLGRATCGYCVQFLPTLQEAQEDYGYKTLYIDIDKISNDDLTAILKTMDLDLDTFGTPTTAIVKNGKVLDTQIGYSDYDTFAAMLVENGLAK